MQLSLEKLNEILSDANEVSEAPNTVNREVVSRLFPLGRDVVNVIQGVRRCGKSTIMRQMARQFGLEGTNRCVFVNFEDPRLSEVLDHELLDGIVECKSSGTEPADVHFFFDEIQNVQNWEKWIHIQLERKKNRQFILTGSNASLLGGKLASSLTGRHVTTEVFPLSLPEFKTLLPGKGVDEYLEWGGFPRAIQYPDPAVFLREYFTDIIHRDVRTKVAARSEKPIVQVAKALFESAGSELSFRKLAAAFDISTEAVKHYVEACQDAYLVLSCPFFSFSERQRAARPSKYYPIDLGLRKSVVTRTGFDLGKKFETAVFLSLRKDFREVFYWRGRGEVDFVVETSNGWLPIQVTTETPQKRHAAALDEFKAAHPYAMPGITVSFLDGTEILVSAKKYIDSSGLT